MTKRTAPSALLLPRPGRRLHGGRAVSGRPVLRALVRLVAVAAAGVLLGGATSFAQTFLPDALRPFANSASGWTLLTALVVTACRASTAVSALLGAIGFAALVVGYQVVSGLRGFPTDETLFLVIGLVVGPFVGVAASWLRREGIRAVLGCAALAGIATGEGAYGLIVVSAYTGWFYWTLIALAGIALLVRTCLRLHSVRDRVLATGLTVLVAAAFFVAYTALGSVVG